MIEYAITVLEICAVIIFVFVTIKEFLWDIVIKDIIDFNKTRERRHAEKGFKQKGDR